MNTTLPVRRKVEVGAAGAAAAGSAAGAASVVAICALALLAACRTTPEAEAPAAPVTQAPPAATVVGSTLYSIDSAASEVLVLVYREGPMAALGHNHVMNVRGITGSVQLFDELPRSRFELGFNVADISVDEPTLRARAGADFATNVSDAARTGTRNNMLGEKLLQAAGFSRIALKSERMASNADGSTIISTRITVRGVDYSVEVPVRLALAENELRASGEFRLKQSTLGLTAYSVMMGALRVADEMTLRFSLVAQRVRL